MKKFFLLLILIIGSTKSNLCAQNCCCDQVLEVVVPGGDFEVPPAPPVNGWIDYSAGQFLGPWEIITGSVSHHDDGHNNLGNGNPNPSTAHLDINGFSVGSVCQDISGFVIGQEYELVFYYAIHNALTMATATVEIDGGTALNETWNATNVGSTIWLEASYNFIATAVTMDLCFSSNTTVSCCGMLIDDIEILVTCIEDMELPEIITMPVDATFQCIDDVPDPFNLDALDNCDNDLTIVFTEEFSSGNLCDVVISRTWTVEDDCGNTASHTQVIVVLDIYPPEIVQPLNDLTVNCDEDVEGQFNSWVDNFGGGIILDNCTDIYSLVDYQIANFDECSENEVIFTFGDFCGNEISETVYFNIVDNQAPVFISLPQDLIIPCDGDPQFLIATWLLQNAFAIVIDNCFYNLENNFSGNFSQSQTVTFTATDFCGNQVSSDAEITITDSPSSSIVGDTLDCQNVSFILDATVSSNVTQIEWLLDGNPFSVIEDPEVDTPGVYELQITTDAGCTSSQFIEVIADTLSPDVIIDGGTISCNMDSLTLQAVIDSAIYQVSIDNDMLLPVNQDSLTFTFYEEGLYYVEVLNPFNHCSYLDTIEVESLGDSPILDLQSDTLTCDVTSLILDITADQSDLMYDWSLNGDMISDEENPSVDQSGMYVVTAITPSGCQTTDSIFIDQNILYPDVSLMGDIIDCDNLEVDVIADVSGNNIILWDGPNGFQYDELIFSTSTPGTYYFSATDAGNKCETIDSIEIISDSDVPVFELSPDTLSCNKEMGNLSFNITSDYESVLWSGPNGFTSDQLQPEFTEPGVYNLSIEVEGNCDVDTSLVIAEDYNPPIFSVTYDSITCNKPFANVTIEALSPDWAELIIILPDGTVSQEMFPSEYTAGQYIITYIGHNGCSSSDTIFIESFMETPEAMLALDHDLTCANNQSLISSSSTDNNLTYQWSGPNGIVGDQASLLVAEPGQYTLTIINELGCENSYTQDVLSFMELPDIYVTGNDIDCIQEVASLNAESSQQIVSTSWSGPNNFSASTSQVDTYDEGWYIVQITDEHGCQSEDSIFVLVDISTPDVILLSEDTILVVLPSVNPGMDIDVISSEAFTIEWIPDNALSCNDCLHPQFTERGESSYTAIVTNENGCTDFVTVEVRYEEDIHVYIPNIFSPLNNDQNNDGFTLFTDENAIVINEMYVYDRWGELIYSNFNFLPNEPSEGWNGRFKGEPVVGGVYLYYFKVTNLFGEESTFVGDVTALH